MERINVFCFATICKILILIGALSNTGCLRPELEGTPAQLVLDLSDLDFDNTIVSSPVRKTMRIRNVGETTANQLHISITGSFSVVTSNIENTDVPACSTQIPSQSTCVVAIDFVPSGLGHQTGSVTIQYLDGKKLQTLIIVVKGSGVPPTQAQLKFHDTSELDFGSVIVGQVSASRTLTLENEGTATATDLTVGGLSHFRFVGSAFPGTGGSCTSTLTAGSTCTMVIEFTPSTSGPISSSLTVTYQDGVAQATRTLSLTGTGITPALLSFTDGSSTNMGSVDVTEVITKTLTLQNSGGSTATQISMSGLTSPFSFKGGSYPGTGGTCGVNLAAGATCTLVVDFSSATAGTFNENLNVDYNNGAATTSTSHAFTATATPYDPANIQFVQTSPLNFGSHDIDTSSSATITLQNTGELDATSLTGSVSPPFAFAGGTYPGAGGTCSSTLAKNGGTCTLRVTFTPEVGGSYSTNLTISYHDGTDSRSKTLALIGTGIPAGKIDTTFANSGFKALNYSSVDTLSTVNLQNDGKILITGSEISPNGDSDITVIRLTTTGDLDSTYGTSGRVVIDYGSNTQDSAHDSKLQPDGKLVITGRTGANIATLRLNTNGTIDLGFDSLGLSALLVPILSSAVGYSVGIQSNGKVVAVGSGSNGGPANTSFALRLTSGGLIDLLAFGLTGIRTYELSTSYEAFHSVDFDSSSRIIVGGQSYVGSVPRATITRLNTSGAIDDDYGSDGSFVHDFSTMNAASEVMKVLVQSDNKTLAVGYVSNGSNDDMLVFRMNPNSSLDTSFGNNGSVKIDIAGDSDRAMSLALDNSGRILVTGYYKENGRYGVALVRLSSNGILDPKFGYGGIVKTADTNYDLMGRDLKIQSDGKIVVGANRISGELQDHLVIRYLP